MVVKSVVATVASFFFVLGILAYLPKGVDPPVADAYSSKRPEEKELHQVVPVEKMHFKDQRVVAERLKHVSSEMTAKIKGNRVPHMKSTLIEARDLLDETTRALEQGEISPVEAQEIAMLTCSGVAKQAQRSVDAVERFKRRINSPKFTAEFAKQLKGHVPTPGKSNDNR